MYRGIVIIPKFFFRQVGAGERELFIEKTKEAGFEIVLLVSNIGSTFTWQYRA